MYVPDKALFSNLLELPEDTNLGKAINDVMKALEAENEAIRDALLKTYPALAMTPRFIYISMANMPEKIAACMY